MLTVDAPGAPAPPTQQQVSYRRWPLSLAIVITGIFMTILDVTIVNVAVPAMQREFGGSLEDVLWVATAYTLTLGVCIPLSSWLGDRIGVTRLYIYALLGFAVCSALCGMAWSLETLILFRVLQAIPGGICPVLAMTLCYRLVPPKFAGVAMGAYGLGGVSAPAVGPVLGGWLVEHISWRMVFLINVPVGVIAGVLAVFVVPRIVPVRVPRFDYAGFATIAVAMASLLLAASKGESWGWESYPIRMLLVGGVLCLALFVVVELQVEHPLLEIRLLGDIQFSVSVLVAAMNFVNLMVTVFYLPVFLQQAQGKGALDAGLLMVPLALVMVVSVPLSGVLTPKLGPRLLGVTGICIIAWSDLLGTQITPLMTQEQTVGWTCLRALGMGIATVPLMVCGLNRFAAEKTNQASAISNVAQQLGAALALAGLGALLTGQQAQHYADRTALLQPDSELARGASELLAQPEALSDTVLAEFLHLGMTLRIDTLASAYSDLFWVLALATAAYMWTPLLMSEASRFPKGSAPAAEAAPEPEPVVVRPEPARAAVPRIPAHTPEPACVPEPARAAEPVGAPEPARAPVPARVPARVPEPAPGRSGGRHRRPEPVPVGAVEGLRPLRLLVPRPPVGKHRGVPGRERAPQLGEWVLSRISDGARSAGRLPEYASTKIRDLPEYASTKIRSAGRLPEDAITRIRDALK